MIPYSNQSFSEGGYHQLIRFVLSSPRIQEHDLLERIPREETPFSEHAPSFARPQPDMRNEDHRWSHVLFSRRFDLRSKTRQGKDTTRWDTVSKGAASPYDGAPLLARSRGSSTVQESSLLDPRYINPTCQACRTVTYWRLFTSSCAVRVQQ